MKIRAISFDVTCSPRAADANNAFQVMFGNAWQVQDLPSGYLVTTSGDPLRHPVAGLTFWAPFCRSPGALW